jgi:hypothetical protein
VTNTQYAISAFAAPLFILLHFFLYSFKVYTSYAYDLSKYFYYQHDFMAEWQSRPLAPT